ncbi:hypothetical protein HK102_007805, partial [Quaeritorhiza haematococci]
MRHIFRYDFPSFLPHVPFEVLIDIANAKQQTQPNNIVTMIPFSPTFLLRIPSHPITHSDLLQPTINTVGTHTRDDDPMAKFMSTNLDSSGVSRTDDDQDSSGGGIESHRYSSVYTHRARRPGGSGTGTALTPCQKQIILKLTSVFETSKE